MPTYSTIPAEIIAGIIAAHPVTREEINIIRDPRDPSRLQGVYRHVHGGRYTVTSYRSRVFKFFELSSGFDSAEDAGKAVIAFYKAHYGTRWERAFRYRKVTPWRLRTVRRRSTVIGYAADVYVRGTAVGVTRADAGVREKGAADQWMWQTPAEAKAAARSAMQRWFQKEVKTLTVPAPNLLFWRG